MLGGCRHVLAVVEGSNDAYLLAALASGSYSFHYYRNMRDVNEELWGCMYDGRACIIAYTAEGLGNIKEAARKIRTIFKTILGPGRAVCLVVIVDSDSEEPATRAEKYYQEIASRGDKAVPHGGRYFASLCSIQAKGPRLCIASWRCSAECWIALATPGNTVTGIEFCDSNTRRQCHRIVRERLGGTRDERDRIKTVKDIIENAEQPWRVMLDELAEGILDGSQDDTP